MTNSHNKIMNPCRKNGGLNTSNNNNTNNNMNTMTTVTDRFFNNKSPPYLNGNTNNNVNGSGKKNRQQRSPSTKYFSSQPSHNVLITPNKNQRLNNNSLGGSQHRSSGVLVLGGSPYSNGISCSPPNFSHFASSKCYDAPAPTALPKPPRHWTSCATEAALTINKRNDVFSHNLKSILNVQA
jgi:hypothetical protein